MQRGRPKKDPEAVTSGNNTKPSEAKSALARPVDLDDYDFENVSAGAAKAIYIDKDKQKRVMDFEKKINEKFGDGTIISGDKAVEKTKKIFIPSPSLELNIALCGGFVKGKAIELYGPESSGKTELILNTIGKVQKEDPNFTAGWLETEFSVDLSDAIKKHGIDKDRFHLIPFDPDKGAEWILDRIREAISNGVFDIIGINSIAGLTPKEEMSKDMGESVIAVQARMMSKFFRVTNALCDKTGTTVIFTNQERDSIGSYGNAQVTGGGKALKFWAWQRIRLTREFIKKESGVDPKKVISIHAKITKNRAATGHPFKECTYYAEYGKGINIYADLATAVKREMPDVFIVSKGAWKPLVEIRGSWIYYPNKNKTVVDKNGNKLAFNGLKEFRIYLQKNKKFFDFIYNKLILHLNREEELGNDLGVDLDETEVDEIKKESKANARYMAGVDEEITDDEMGDEE